MSCPTPAKMCLPLTFALLLVSAGCRDERPIEPERTLPALDPQMQTYDPLPAARPDTEFSPKPMVPLAAQREILVGGCNELCEDPRLALEGFLIRVLRGDGVDEVRPWVNTAVLVHNGQRHGDAWADLFLRHDLATRRESIDKWLKGWLSWADRIIDPADRSQPGVGIEVVEENQRRYAVLYRHPDLDPADDGSSTGAIWRIVLSKRGYEWLVAEIDETPRRK